MTQSKFKLISVFLLAGFLMLLSSCEQDDIIRYQATGGLSMDIVNGTALINWPSQFSAHITITAFEGEEGGEGFDPIETDVTIKRDPQDSTRWAAAELVEVPVEVYVSVSIRANIAGQTWGGSTYIYLDEDMTITQEIILEPVSSSNQYVQDFNSGSLPSDWVFDGDPLEFTASILGGELHMNAFADNGTGTAIIERFFNNISHIGYNLRIENNSIEAWGIGCQVANEYASGGFIIGKDVEGVTKACLVEGDGISIFMLDSTLIDFDLNTDYTIDLNKSGAVVALIIDGNTILEYSGAGTLDTSIVFFTTSYCNQIIDNVVIDHSGEIFAPGSNNNPPYAPSSPSPASGSIGVNPTEVTLSWTGGDPDGDFVYYTLNWGNDSSMNNYEYMESESYTLFELQEATTYAWQVTSEDDYGEITQGPVWTFTTGIDTSGGSWNPGTPPASPSHGDEWTAYMGESQVPLEMIFIDQGSYEQGAYSGEQGALYNEYPQHTVTLNYGFWMGKYEVTQSQWEAVTGDNPSYFIGDDNPVDSVSWNEIYTDFLDVVNLNNPSGSPWRLQSESEWEYACRAGTTTRFYWGDDLNETDIDNYAWYSDNSGSSTHVCGQKLPNAWGLYDMIGNVDEWCEDYYHSNYDGAPNNGDPWLSPTSSSRVFRGGSWYYDAGSCRSARRQGYNPSYGYFMLGFRIVFSP